ncbi:MAG: amidohydrolase family protein [Chloroflexia bacterium]
MAQSVLLRNVRPEGGPVTDLLMLDGIIAQVETNLVPATPEIEVIEGNGHLLVPGFVDGHAHIDKTLWGLPWHPHEAGPLLVDKIENERRLRRELRISPREQSARVVRQGISKGTTHIRTHVDVDTETKLAGIEGVLATRAELRDVVDIQVVAFPQSGLLVRPGTVELMGTALGMGVEVVGGLDPAGIDRDPAGHLDAIFGMADRYGAEVDIHLHDPGELGAFQVELIAERTQALGLKGRVAISHAFCLGQVEEPRFATLVELLVENDIAIMTHGPGNRQFPPILRLREAGVRLFSGNDGIRDTWGPYGNADMLERAWILGYRSNFRRDEEVEVALQMVTYGGADVLGARDYGLGVGCRADCVVLDGETLTEAVMNRAPRTCVFKGGRIVAKDGRCLV